MMDGSETDETWMRAMDPSSAVATQASTNVPPSQTQTATTETTWAGGGRAGVVYAVSPRCGEVRNFLRSVASV